MKIRSSNRRVKPFAALGRDHPRGNVFAVPWRARGSFSTNLDLALGIEMLRNHPGSKNLADEATSRIESFPAPQSARKTRPVPPNQSSFLLSALSDLFEKGFGTTLQLIKIARVQQCLID